MKKNNLFLRNNIQAKYLKSNFLKKLLEEYKKFIPDHPFIAIDKSNIRQKIIQLTEDKEMLLHKKSEGQKWVTKYHGIKNVVESLYSHYEKLSWIK